MRLILDVGKKYLEITGSLSDAFVSELKEMERSANLTELILDFKGVKALSSVALGAIYIANHRLRNQNKSLQIINASEPVIRILRLTNLENTLVQPLAI